MTMAERLIREHRVAAIPGSAFGATRGCTLRISYGALDAGTVHEGIAAAHSWTAAHRRRLDRREDHHLER